MTGPVRITLITGDTVTYQVHPGGRVAATVDLGPGRTSVRYRASTENGGYYFVPDDVAGYVRRGLLDKELFNLRYLADNGYADDRMRRLPVIVRYREQRGQDLGVSALKSRTAELPARAASTPVDAIDGAAVELEKAKIGKFWTAVSGRPAEPGAGAAAAAAAAAQAAGPPAPGLGADRDGLGLGLAKVWLDAKATALDDVSNAQIGAPAAWAAGLDGTGVQVGVLDTGVDATHPDLAGRIVEARSFVPAGQPGGGDPADATDRHGHGTHVASTIAGSGAASDGRYAGVAPGGRLLVGKVLDDRGNGFNSDIIAGMEWIAATKKARIVSMSLGGGPTDGTDPMSTAVNELSAEHGTLFVIAAGNDGPEAGTVAAPGAATSALTVGAVDSQDRLAPFSSRGPRVGADFAVKPEITAPGVRIIAARGAGTLLGEPVGEHYTSASGTSMATPHVAGAAAILAQQHPDWGPERLKNALISSAHRVDGYTSYEQGAGRLDVARAITQAAVPDTASISAGFTDPYTGQTLTRTVTYHNHGTAPVTLALTAPVSRGDEPAPEGMVRLDTDTLTVPGGGTAAVTLTVDPLLGGTGFYTGALVATDAAGGTSTIPIGFRKGAALKQLRVKVHTSLRLDPLRPNYGLNPVSTSLMNDDDPDLAGEERVYVGEQWAYGSEPGWFELTMMLPAGGVYDVNAGFFWQDREDGRVRLYTLVDPEVDLADDTTLTFDLDTHARVDVRTPRPSETVTTNLMTAHTSATGIGYYSGSVAAYEFVANSTFWMTPTRRPSIGGFTFLYDDIRAAPQVRATVRGARRVDLAPRYLTEWGHVPKFAADRRYDLATSADVRAGRDVKGKVVLFDRHEWDDLEAQDKFFDNLRRANEAGAAGILTEASTAGVMQHYPEGRVIPLLKIDREQAAAVRAAMAGTSRPTIDLDVTTSVPYEYKLVFYVDHAIPDRLLFAPGAKDLTEVAATYHGQYERARLEFGPAPDITEVDHTFAPVQRFSYRASHSFVGSVERTEYYNTTGPEVLWSRAYGFVDWLNGGGTRNMGSSRAFARPTTEREDWNEPMIPTQAVPGPDMPGAYGMVFPCEGCRQGDRLRVRSLGDLGLGQYADAGDPSHQVYSEAGTERVRVFRDGTEVESGRDDLGLPYYSVPAGPGRYRVESVLTDTFSGAHSGGRIDTTWTFTSRRPDRGEVEQPYGCIDGLVFGDEAPCAWLPMINLGYELGSAADDTVAAGRPHTVTVRARTGPGTPASLSGLRVWTSTDGGDHWVPALVVPAPDGGFRVQVSHPHGAAGSRVAVKAHAVDRAGNTVEQVITDAYRLR